jgi:hypothetical protein
MTMKGALIAASVAGLFASAIPLVASADKDGGDVKCAGINACSGKGACSSATNSCSGQNGCKGKGWVKASAKDCKAKHGTVVADAKKK